MLGVVLRSASWIQAVKAVAFRAGAVVVAGPLCLHVSLRAEPGTVVPAASRNDFERANTDVFMFEEKNVGSLKKIRIGHDGSGLGAGWHLQRVVVENLTTGQVYTFEVNRCVLASYSLYGSLPVDSGINQDHADGSKHAS